MTTRRQLLACALPLFAQSAVAQTPTVQDEVWLDSARQREVPVLMRWPAGEPRGWVVYSHGLGGHRTGADAWGQAWAAAGFAVAHVQHAGSDIEIFKKGVLALRSAGNAQQLIARAADVRFVLDESARRQAAAKAAGAASPWATLPLERVGLAGHSFGARTVMAVAGQRFDRAPQAATAQLPDARFKAFVALSPGLAEVTLEQAQQQLAPTTRPMLVVTGSEDGEVLGNRETPESRRMVFEALPAGAKALLWLQGADHYTFAGNHKTLVSQGPIRRAAGAPALEPQHHGLVAAATTQWWRERLLGEAAVAPAGLAAQDVWQRG